MPKQACEWKSAGATCGRQAKMKRKHTQLKCTWKPPSIDSMLAKMLSQALICTHAATPPHEVAL